MRFLGRVYALFIPFRAQFASHREVTMLDLFYVGVVVAFFVLLWEFTKASERL